MSRKHKLWLVLGLAVALALVLAAGCGQKPAQQDKPPATEAPKTEAPKTEAPKTEAPPAGEVKLVSTEDKPQGCASCHVKVADDKDYRLEAEIKKIQGHPQVTATKVKECITCHGANAGERAFKKLLHARHYKEGSVFVKNYDGACVNCHKMSEDGKMVVAGLAPAGTKLVAIQASTVDKAPEGCASCHKKVADDKDYRLETEVKKIKGHPTVSATTVKECMMCHSSGNKPFKQVLHRIHMKSDIFKNNYGASCTNCHSRSPDGVMSVKGL